MSEFLEQLNKSFFWDIDPAYLGEDKSKKIIIERVINFGNTKDLQLLKNFYGVKEIINVVCDLAYIDPKTLNFISILFDIPKTNFKCYSRKQLTRQHWNY